MRTTTAIVIGVAVVATIGVGAFFFLKSTNEANARADAALLAAQQAAPRTESGGRGRNFGDTLVGLAEAGSNIVDRLV